MTTRPRRPRETRNLFLDPYRDGFAERLQRHAELLALSERFEQMHGREPTHRELWQFELETVPA
jgi:hypothetical protein